jgi:hypothetical protein
MEGGMYVLMMLIVGYREPAIVAPTFDDYAACAAAGKEMEMRTKALRGTQSTSVIWFCSPYSSEPRRE